MTLCPSHVKRDSETEPWWLNSAKIQVKSRRKYLAVLECNGGGGFKIIQKDRPYIIGLKKCEVSLPTQLCWTVTDKTGTSNKQLLTSGVKYCSNVPFCTYNGEHFSEDTHSCTQHPYFQTKNKKDNYGAFLLLQPEIHISQIHTPVAHRKTLTTDITLLPNKCCYTSAIISRFQNVHCQKQIKIMTLPYHLGTSLWNYTYQSLRMIVQKAIPHLFWGLVVPLWHGHKNLCMPPVHVNENSTDPHCESSPAPSYVYHLHPSRESSAIIPEWAKP